MPSFCRGNKVQAFDPVLGQWLNGSLNAVDHQIGRVQVHWAGYNKSFALWLDISEVRTPEDERPLDRRNPVIKSNFPKRQHPKYLQKDDRVCVRLDNKNCSDVETVAKNDCFRGEVRILYLMCLVQN